VAVAVAAAVATAVALIVVGGVLASTSGQLFVAGVGGAVVGLALAGAQGRRRTARRVAIGLAVAAVAAGALGTWLIALGEGGTLGLAEFLWATSGLLVPAEVVVATIAAAWGVGAGPIRS
jgi:hypothetical protein